MNVVSWNTKNIFTVFLMVMIVSVIVGLGVTSAKMVVSKYMSREDA